MLFCYRWLCLLFCFICANNSPLLAQSLPRSLDGKLQIHSATVFSDTLAADWGTRGILLVWEYSLEGDARQSLRAVRARTELRYQPRPKAKPLQIYQDTSQMLLLRVGKNQRAQLFVPFRLLPLKGGDYYDKGSIQISILLPKLMEWKNSEIAFEQPMRCQMDFDLLSAAVKEQLRAYDPDQNYPASLPDPYWQIIYPQAQKPIFAAPTQIDNYEATPVRTFAYVLQREQVLLQFFDEDGKQDSLLASIELPPCTGDAVFRKTAQQASEIKELSYTLQYQQLTQQPITVYARKGEREGREGVLFTVDYNLARHFQQEQAVVGFSLLDEDGNRLPPPRRTEAASSSSPTPDSLFQLDLRGRWAFFIPATDWNNATKSVEFSILTVQGQRADATPCVLLEPIVFESAPVQLAQISLQTDVVQANQLGFSISFAYALRNDIGSGQELQIYIRPASQKPITTAFLLPTTQPLSLSSSAALPAYTRLQPNGSDSLRIFVPYSAIDTGKLQFSAQWHGESSFFVLDTMLQFKLPVYKRLANININNTGDYSVQNDYGRVLQIAYRMPANYKDNSRLQIRVWRGAEEIETYQIVNCDTCRREFAMPRDTGAIEIMLPYRYFSAADSVSAQIWVSQANDPTKILSDTLLYTGRLSALLNVECYQIQTKKLRIDPKALTTTGESAWQLELAVGSQRLYTRPLPQADGYPAALRARFDAEYCAHRDDKISLTAINTQADEVALSRRLSLYNAKQGDLLKEQSGHLKISKKFPLTAAAWKLRRKK